MNSSTIILVLIIILTVAGLSFQYLKGIGKSFQSNQDSSLINSTSLQQKQKQQAEDIEEQRRAYMENVKQRMRDAKQR